MQSQLRSAAPTSTADPSEPNPTKKSPEPSATSQAQRASSFARNNASSTAVDGDADRIPKSTSTKPSETSKRDNNTSAHASDAPSPKPAKSTKEIPRSLPQGSGLISNALFGVEDGANQSRSAPNIILHIPLHGSSNRIINFARLAEEQYGFAALHPRLAAQRERLARVAAASDALEKNEKGAKGQPAGESGAEEDLSLEVDRDSDLDGDLSIGGLGAGLGLGANGAAGGEVAADGKKKRRKKMEEYDRDDPFVDDSELAWQEHAAASKDGFFVYSGPLVPEGDRVQVER